MSWKFYLRTILIIILAFLLIFGIYKLSKALEAGIEADNAYYSDLMRVTDKESLDYALENGIKEFLLSGIVKSNQEFTYPELSQSFAGIRKKRYRYETTVKTETTRDSNGVSHTTTKTVHEWEYKNTEEVKFSTVTLFDRIFLIENIPYSFCHINYEDVASFNINNRSRSYYYESDDIRYSYEVIPMSWNITIVCSPELKMIRNLYGKTIEQVIKPVSTKWIKPTFIILTIIIIIGVIVIWSSWESIFRNFLVE